MSSDIMKQLEEEVLQEANGIKILKESYFDIIKILDHYLDIPSENIHVIALWIISSYFYDEFETFPYLFLNAMKGSGKSRTLRLISFLGNGNYSTYISEAHIFRSQGLLCIDEFESFANKEKQALRELLNSGYKKGATVTKYIKKKSIDGENQQAETFETYRPVAMANIWGMESVLGDRCINLILERSDHDIKTRLIENYSSNQKLVKLVENLKRCRLCRVVTVKELYRHWNDYLCADNLTTLISLTTQTTLTTQIYFPEKLIPIYNKIYKSKIKGRNLELFLPLLSLSYLLGEDVFEITLDIFTKMDKDKKDNDKNDNVDLVVYEFVSRFDESLEFYNLKDLCNEFRLWSEITDEWVNPKWFGRCLNRLNLVKSKRRKNKGREVILNSNKAKEKIKMFGTEETCDNE